MLDPEFHNVELGLYETRIANDQCCDAVLIAAGVIDRRADRGDVMTDTSGGSTTSASTITGTKAIDRALIVLTSFVGTPEQGITELATRSGLKPSTVHRIVQALVKGGYLEQNAETDRYRLGHAAHVLGQTARESWGFDRALPILERVGSITGESVNMGIADGNDVVVVLRVESVQPLRFDQPIGSRISMHCSSMGKALLAFSDQPLPELDFVPITNTTISSPEEFERDLAECRRRGFSIDNEESIKGVSCVGAPILNDSGVAVAAIAVQAPSVRMTPDRIQVIGERTIAAAEEIRETLGLDRLSDLIVR